MVIGVFTLLAIVSTFRSPVEKSSSVPKEKQIILHAASNDAAAMPPHRLNNATILVARVIDGDTVEIENGVHVRYIGMDAPETVDPRASVQCFGQEATARNRELVEGKYVRMEKDVNEYDPYGRLLRYVFINDAMINLLLVKEGYARAATLPPDVKYHRQFLGAEREAREEKRGLWNACPIKQ